MSITLTNHQFDEVKKAAEWYKNAEQNFGVFGNSAGGESHLSNGQSYTFCGYAGSGKSQPLNCAVMTTQGPVRMGDVKVGQKILHPYAGETEVTHIHPQGHKDVYEIEFRDKSKTYCSPDHLWTVKTANTDWRTFSLSELLERKIKHNSGPMKFKIPLQSCDYDNKEDLPIDPYVLGVLLGDGYLHASTPAVTINDKEPEILEKILSRLPKGVTNSSYTRGSGCIQVRLSTGEKGNSVNPITEALRSLNLRVRGSEKFIPDMYLYSNFENRKELLKGLMDSDGSICNNRTSFSNKTLRLVEGVVSLVQSLGGTAIVSTSDRKDEGIEYTVNVKTPFNPFWFERKKCKWKFSTKNPPSRYIKNVKYVGKVEQQCITVKEKDGLYFTDNCIVTHNSTCVGSMIEHIGLTPEQVMFMAPTGKAAKVLTTKLRQDGWTQDATTIHKAIYMPKAMQADRIKRELDDAELHRDWVASKGDIGREHKDPSIQTMSVDQVDRHMSHLENALHEAMDGEGPAFTLKLPDEIPSETKLFVVDEASMVGTRLADDLATYGYPILALGDPGQLPPVGDTWGFNMDDPDTFLTEIHRQAAENPIIRLATMARQGKDLEVGDYGDDVRVVNRRDDDVTLDPDRDAMVLVGTHKTKWAVTSKIRKMLGIKESGPMKDEPLLICKNSRKHASLVNGSILRCDTDYGDLRNRDARLTLNMIDDEASGIKYTLQCAQSIFEENVFRKRNSFSASTKQAFAAKVQCEHVDFGHALTVHKSQGSEWNDVVVHDESNIFREDGSKWLYTGITRAADKLTVVVT